VEDAETNAAVARAFANAATQNTQGINLPGDFRVTALPTPGLFVNIAPGAMTLVNRQAPGQSYIGTALETTMVPIPKNDTGSPQYHLVIARIIDDDFSPWQQFTDPNKILYGPFFEPYVVSAASTTRSAYELAAVNYTAEALALIRMPAGAQSVLPAYVNFDGIERRRLARPRNDFDGDQKPVTAYQAMLTSQTSWRDWPAEASWPQDVPYWATEALAEIEINAIKADGAGDVDLRLNFGGITSGITPFDYNGNAGTSVGYVETLPRTASAKLDVRTLAGGTHTLKMQGQRTPAFATANTGNVWVDQQQQVRMRVTYRERIV
jgi:hypothetical protein